MFTDRQNTKYLIGRFEAQKRDAEESLRFAEGTSWFRLHEGGIDITETHKQGLRDQVAEFQLVLVDLQIDVS